MTVRHIRSIDTKSAATRGDLPPAPANATDAHNLDGSETQWFGDETQQSVVQKRMSAKQPDFRDFLDLRGHRHSEIVSFGSVQTHT